MFQYHGCQFRAKEKSSKFSKAIANDRAIFMHRYIKSLSPNKVPIEELLNIGVKMS